MAWKNTEMHIKICETWRDQGGWWQNTEVALSLLSGILTALTRQRPAQEVWGGLLLCWINLVEGGCAQESKEELIIPVRQMQAVCAK